MFYDPLLGWFDGLAHDDGTQCSNTPAFSMRLGLLSVEYRWGADGLMVLLFLFCTFLSDYSF